MNPSCIPPVRRGRRACRIALRVGFCPHRPGVKKIDWQSPVAKQFGLRSIPQFRIYGPAGRLQAEDKGREGASARQQVDH